jgi:hypothetical protein
VLVLGGAVVARADPPIPPLPPTAVWTRSPADARWVLGQVEVATSPAAVWSRIEAVEEWARVFSDIRGLTVLWHTGSVWRLRLDTWSMKSCGPHDYVVRIEPERRVFIDIDASGAEAKARIMVKSSGAPGRAVITYQLYVDTKGVMGWFIPEKRLRRAQEEMVVRYLGDFARVFGTPTSVVATVTP